MEEKKQPGQTFRLGGVRAKVWENETENGTMRNVTPIRPYKDGEASKDSTSFSRGDLLSLRKVLDWAHDWIWEQEQATPEEEAKETARIHVPRAEISNARRDLIDPVRRACFTRETATNAGLAPDSGRRPELPGCLLRWSAYCLCVSQLQ